MPENYHSDLYQPILSQEPEPSHALSNVLTAAEMIALLREEEDYWEGEQHNTKLIFTKLRKIFYDQWGWNSELIKGAAKIEQRYEVKIVDDPTEFTKPVRRYKSREYQPKHRLVTYTDHDRIYGSSRAGQVPFIYQNDHQEVRLPDGNYCDIAHILAGVDAWNYKAMVSPLPPIFGYIRYLFPHVDENMDIVTWLGDIASSSGDFFFKYLKNGKKPLDTDTMQGFINVDAPGSDMLGDIDAYVVAKCYGVGSSNGQRLSDIFTDYCLDPEGKGIRNRRFQIFCDWVGLKGWDGENFSNESQWLKYYYYQLRDNTSFQVFSLTDEKLDSMWMPLVIWLNGYKNVLKFRELLEIFLIELKRLRKLEA